jgi:ABC-type nitrate/sulfonate/bicarbonate transport system permease component
VTSDLDTARGAREAAAPATPAPARGRRRSPGSALSQPWWSTAASIVAGLLLWQLAVSVFHPNPLAIVGPWDTLTDAVTLARDGTLGADIATSLEEFAAGMALAAVAGMVVGFGLGLSRRASAFLDPWITVCYTVPVIAVAPLLIVAMGLGPGSKIVIVATSAFFPIAINCQAGTRQADQRLRDVCLAFGASPGEILRFALLRGTAPYLLTGIRLAIGRGLIGLVAGDLFGSTRGLGFLILSGQQNLRTNDLYVGVAVLSVIGLILTAVTGLLERRYAAPAGEAR